MKHLSKEVSFPLAKLLKEKGFNKPLPSSCFIKEEYSYTSTMVHEVLDMDFEYILRPTIAEVIDWLYEKHGIWIEVTTDVNGKFCWLVKEFKASQNDYNSPKEAYEVAIEYTLKNLINHD